MKKILLFSLLGLLLGNLFPLVVEAGLGVSPATIRNERMKPGSVYRQQIIISQAEPDEDLQVTIEKDAPGINDWVSFELGEMFTIPKGTNKFTFDAIVTVPANADMRTYEGVIRIKAVSADAGSTGGGVSVIKGARLDLEIVVSDRDVSELLVRAVDISDVVSGEALLISLKVENLGNVSSVPTLLTLDITDLNDNLLQSLRTTEFSSAIQPGELQDITTSIEHNLPSGEYFSLVKVYLDDLLLREERIPFRVESLITQPVSDELPGELSSQTVRVIVSIFLLIIWLIVILLVLRMVIRSRRKSLSRKQLYILVVLAGLVGLLVAGITIALVWTESSPSPAVEGIYTAETSAQVLEQEFPSLPTVFEVGKSGYSVYAEPSFSSPIIYTAGEGDSFDVRNEVPGWYMIWLPDGSTGWLPELSVKQREAKIL